MQAEIICIGDELLIGQTINSNAAWIGALLNEAGIRIYRNTSIADDRSEIVSALDEASGRSQVVLITGGLGPTKDDITKHTLREYFGGDYRLDQDTLERNKAFFASRGLPMLEVNIRQADVPEVCTVVPNLKGTAPGMWFERNGVVYVSMPGVPHEMQSMMEETILPRLLSMHSPKGIIHRTILTIGVGESFLADKIKDWENSLEQLGIKLAYLPSPGMVKLRMSYYEGNHAEARAMIARKEDELMALIGEHVYGYDKDTLTTAIRRLLTERHETLSMAESCTGGYIGHLITSEPGASDFFLGSAVAYLPESKAAVLGVDPALIERCNVVSAEVAEAMAEGARRIFSSTYALSVTGIAGPTGGTPEIPVGTIYLGISTPQRTYSRKLQLGKRRESNIQMAANQALDMVRKEILSGNKEN